MAEEAKMQPQPQDSKDIEENKVFAAIAYLGILCLVPLLAKKDSPFAQFHAKQGLVLLVIQIVGWVIFWIPVIGWILLIVVYAVALVGLIQALMGKYWKIPGVANIAEKF
jgi:uncharacterized membrane protein